MHVGSFSNRLTHATPTKSLPGVGGVFLMRAEEEIVSKYELWKLLGEN
jgi:hypothetical protein